jgi:hypothetical protein
MSENLSGWVKLYHPTGAQVTFPLMPGVELTHDMARAYLRSVDNLLEVGFSVNAPGLEDGEFTENIVNVCRREKTNTDGTTTPIVDLYPQNASFKLLSMYLNTAHDVKAFEQAAGIPLARLPLYEGEAAPEKGKDAKRDKFIFQLASPIKMVWKLNPKWEGESDKKHAKRQFVRWADIRPEAPAPAPEALTWDEASEYTTREGRRYGDMNTNELEELRKAIVAALPRLAEGVAAQAREKLLAIDTLLGGAE